MRINFYGATEKAAENKASKFVTSLKKTSEKLIGKQINVTEVNKIIFQDPNCVIHAYKFSTSVVYNISHM